MSDEKQTLLDAATEAIPDQPAADDTMATKPESQPNAADTATEKASDSSNASNARDAEITLTPLESISPTRPELALWHDLRANGWFYPSVLDAWTITQPPDGSVNPRAAALGQRAYDIQSRVLRVPDCIGPCVPDYPRCQASQVRTVARLAQNAIFMTILNGLWSLVSCSWEYFSKGQSPSWAEMRFEFCYEAALTMITYPLAVFVLLRFSPRRRRDYDWSTRWS